MEKHYETIQAILEEAGLSHRQLIDGVVSENGVIQLRDFPLADRNYDDNIDAGDVVVLNGGEVLAIENVDAVNGVITLTEKTSRENLRVLYNYSNISPEFVIKVRAEVIAEIERLLGGAIESVDEEILRYIVRIYCAGKLLVREYGYAQSTEETSKDGYKRIALAKKELLELKEGFNSASSGGSAWGYDSGDMFARRN